VVGRMHGLVGSVLTRFVSGLSEPLHSNPRVNIDQS
jgi:hypothetical protein